MIKKIAAVFALAALFALPAAMCFAQQDGLKGGQHNGEAQQLEASIDFFNSYGKTVANDKGTFYYFYGSVTKEDKVYPQKYWGEYPLFFFGGTAGVKVTLTNKGPRQVAKIRVKTEANILKTDGSSGESIMDPKSYEIEVPRGETKIIDASFISQYREGMDSGLDRFTVKVLHMSEGGGQGNPEPSLIMVKEGVFCPPKYVKK